MELTEDQVKRLEVDSGPFFREPETRTFTVLYIDREGEWALDDFVQWVSEAVPAEFRSTATVSFVIPRYDGDSTSLEVTYTRPETQQEIDARIVESLRSIQESENSERRQFERLRAKFKDAAA